MTEPTTSTEAREDVRIVREALGPKVPEKHASYLERCRNHTIAALDRLEARLAEVEKERDEARDDALRLGAFSGKEEAIDRAEAAEARVKVLEDENESLAARLRARQQYEVALAIYRRYGLSGWGCRNA